MGSRLSSWLLVVPYLACVGVVFAMQPDGNFDGHIDARDFLQSAWTTFAFPARVIERVREVTLGQVVDANWLSGDKSIYLWALVSWAVLGAMFAMSIEKVLRSSEQDDEF